MTDRGLGLRRARAEELRRVEETPDGKAMVSIEEPDVQRAAGEVAGGFGWSIEVDVVRRTLVEALGPTTRATASGMIASGA